MLKASELRIGNFATRHFEKGEGDFTTCTARDIFDCKRSEVEPDFKFHYEGIELTPEWLERFGFYKYSHDWILQQGDANQIPLIRIFNPSEKLFLEDKSGTIIRTVHHLQNFFHALYSRELELKK